jgi:hypothetical protein
MEARQLLRTGAETLGRGAVKRGATAGLLVSLAVLAWLAAVGPPLPAVAASLVTVSGDYPGGWRECPYDARARLAGGCVERGETEARYTIVTPFGGFALATCTTSLTAHVAAYGEIAIDKVLVSGGEGGGVCGDILACRPHPRVGRRPWTGRVERLGDGRAAVTVRACLDTCAGWFEGPLQLEIRRTASGRSELVADDAEIGESGIEIDGRWPLKGPALRVR